MFDDFFTFLSAEEFDYAPVMCANYPCEAETLAFETYSAVRADGTAMFFCVACYDALLRGDKGKRIEFDSRNHAQLRTRLPTRKAQGSRSWR